MADKENWDEEIDGSGKDDMEQQASGEEESPDSSAAARVTQGGAAAEETPSNDKDSNQDGDLGAAKSESQQEGQRAKRAQRTRRAKVNPPSGNNNAAPQNQQSPVANAPQGSAPASPVQGKSTAQKQEHQPAAKSPPKKSTSAPTPPSTPVQVPPQISGYQKDETDEYEYVYDEEPSRILAGLCCMAEGVLNAFRGAWHLVKGIIQAMIKVVFFPALFGTLLYCGIVYVVGTYLLDMDDHQHLQDFQTALKYVFRCGMWTSLPVVSAFVVTHFDNHNKHQQFLYESLVDAIIQVINGWVMSIDASSECLVWLGPVSVVSAIFRCLYWLSLFCMSNKWKQVLKTPAVLNSAVLTTYNVGRSLQSCFIQSSLKDQHSPLDSPVTVGVQEPEVGTAPSGQEPGI